MLFWDAIYGRAPKAINPAKLPAERRDRSLSWDLAADVPMHRYIYIYMYDMILYICMELYARMNL